MSKILTRSTFKLCFWTLANGMSNLFSLKTGSLVSIAREKKSTKFFSFPQHLIIFQLSITNNHIVNTQEILEAFFLGRMKTNFLFFFWLHTRNQFWTNLSLNKCQVLFLFISILLRKYLFYEHNINMLQNKQVLYEHHPNSYIVKQIQNVVL